MAIAYRAGSGAGDASGTNLTVNKPTGTADGDILIAVLYREGGVWTLPSGWAQWGSDQRDSGNNIYVTVAWKRASSEPSSWTFNLSTTTWRTIAIAAYSGALESGDPIDVGPTGNNGSINAVSAASITTATANAMRIVVKADYFSSDVAVGSSGMTKGISYGGCQHFYLIQASTGSSGTKTFGEAGTAYWATFHLAIKPATGGGAQTITPTGIASGEGFGGSTLAAGAVSVAPTGIASGEGFGGSTLAAGAVSVAPAGIASGEGFGAATLAALVTIAPAGIASNEAVGVPVLPGETSNYSVQVGDGYTDVSPKQLVRTSSNYLYTIAPNCDSYPDYSANGLTQTIRVHKANNIGIPTGFTRQDSSNEPAAINGCAAALDSDDNIRIVWAARNTNSNTRYLRYAVFNTSTDTWGSVTTIASDLDYDDWGQGDQSVAVAVDASDVVHVVYLGTAGDGSIYNRRIYYRNNSGGTWSSATQIDSDVSHTSNLLAWHPSIAFDSDGRIVVAYLIGGWYESQNAIIYSRVYSGSWNSSVQVSAAGDNVACSIDQSTSLLITPDGTYHLAYILYSATNSQKYIRYRYSTNNGASWSGNNPTNQATHNPSLGWTGSKVRILAHGTPDGSNHGENLYYLEGDGGAAAWGSWTQFVVGTNFDSSVNARWSQFHHHYPATLDVAYWNDNYPNVLYAGTEVFKLDIAPAGIVSGEAFGDAVLTNLVVVAPAGVATAEEFGAATVLPGEVAIAATGIGSAEAVGAAVVLPGAATVQPAGVASDEAVGAAVVLPGEVAIAATGIASAEAVGDALINAGGAVVNTSGIASAEGFGLGAIALGDVVVVAEGVTTGEGFGDALVAPGERVVQAAGIGSAEGFGLAAMAAGAATVLPAGVASAEGFGDAAILPGVVVVLAVGVASAEGFGATLLALGGTTVAPAGIGSGEVFGDALALSGPVTVAPAGVASGEAFGVALVTGQGLAQFMTAAGIGSAEAFGLAMVLLQLVASRTMSIGQERRVTAVQFENRTVVIRGG